MGLTLDCETKGIKRWYSPHDFYQTQLIISVNNIVHNEMYGIFERELFAYGFRLGGRLKLETLTGLNFDE